MEELENGMGKLIGEVLGENMGNNGAKEVKKEVNEILLKKLITLYNTLMPIYNRCINCNQEAVEIKRVVNVEYCKYDPKNSYCLCQDCSESVDQSEMIEERLTKERNLDEALSYAFDYSCEEEMRKMIIAVRRNCGYKEV